MKNLSFEKLNEDKFNKMSDSQLIKLKGGDQPTSISTFMCTAKEGNEADGTEPDQD
ncbi:MAG: hypothetical protein RQ875_10720 [Vicingaceae bacterium]|nr:hypothetical protein [Vicingaceae bacterium]